MRVIPFVKMQGAGNDFVVLAQEAAWGLDLAAAARAACARRTGIGADGLLVIGPSRAADAHMRMLNPDGTEDMCGNGLRCAARWLAAGGSPERLLARAPEPQGWTASIETLAGVRRAEIPRPGGPVVVEMGRPDFRPQAIPARLEAPRIVDFPLEVAGEALRITSLSTGTAHTVLFVDTLPEDEKFERVSRALERHLLFPERTSVLWAVPEGRARARVRIWERGAGETWGCGTGACAVAAAGLELGLLDAPVQVVGRGGPLEVEWDPSGPMRLIGGAEAVFAGRWAWE